MRPYGRGFSGFASGQSPAGLLIDFHVFSFYNYGNKPRCGRTIRKNAAIRGMMIPREGIRMKKNVRRIALLLTFALLSGCLAGCAHGPAPRPETPPASGQADDDYPPQEDQTQDPYGHYVLSDAIEPGKYPPPTDEVVAEADAWLTAQEGIVQDFREKNKAVLEDVAGKLFAISGQYPDRKYYYEIADRNLVTSLVLTEDDPEEAALREELTEALNQISGLPGADAFERVCYNTWALDIPFLSLIHI